MARSLRFQITAGAAAMLLMFFVAFFFASRQTFREHAAQVETLARVGAATSADVVVWLSEMWKRRFEENNIEFEVIDRSARTTVAVATEIQQVALNFLTNAEYAVLHHPAPVRSRKILMRTFDTDKGFVRLEIDDSGADVSTEHTGNLFQPFFTTKPVGEGTGLGLSVSYGIVQSHGGTIGHERGSLGGARFYLELPAEGGPNS